ncbi:MAG: CinA family protein [Clostridiales bacterium]|nr:CinA family protein [Clostridiales bacterium]
MTERINTQNRIIKPEEKAVELLTKSGKTVATAESCTAGLVSKRITDVPGASGVFHWGAVTYANYVKEKVLGVRHETIVKFGAVSEQTAREMALGIKKSSGADYGISVTGFAGPGCDEEGKAPGLIYIAVAGERGVALSKIETGSSDREFNRNTAAGACLRLLCDYIENTLEKP